VRNSAALLVALVLTCAKPMTPTTPSNASAQPYNGAIAVLPDGSAVHIEVATDDDTRAQGLMFRDRIPEGTGMLFVFVQSGDYPFWMKNTLVPLDMIWVDDQKRVVHVQANVPPCKADPCPSYPPHAVAKYVLELGGGQAAKHRVVNGSTLTFQHIDNIIVR
jgi:uncharacterized membrane protein (UPF0127 family)